MKGLSEVDTVSYHIRIVKEDYSLIEGIHFFLDLKPRFVKELSTTTEKSPSPC